MDILLIDDNANEIRRQSGVDFLENDNYVCLIKHIKSIKRNAEEQELIDMLDGAKCVLIHESFNDSSEDGSYISGHRENKKRIFQLCKDNLIPCVEFSGGTYESEYYPQEENLPEGGKMIKTELYERLRGFLDDYAENGRPDIRGLVEGTIKEKVRADGGTKAGVGGEAVPMASCAECCEAAIGAKDFPSLNDREAVRKFVEELSRRDCVVFDTREIKPEALRLVLLNLRLSLEELGRGSFVPVVFLADGGVAGCVRKFVEAGAGDVLLCKGSYVMDSESGKIVFPEENAAIQALDEKTYKRGFLDRIKVQPRSNVGNHTIANEWGAYVMARYLPGESESLKKWMGKTELRDPLYLKYLRVARLTEEGIAKAVSRDADEKPEPVKVPELVNIKKVLFIDDQDDVWTPVIKGLFPGDEIELEVLGKNNKMINEDAAACFLSKEARKIVDNSEDYDLIILDLRLGGDLEENVVIPDNISGIKLLKEIMERNRGQQVVVFTSSNKAWNMKKVLVDYHAAGYYIKESPDMLVGEDESRSNIENLVRLIEGCDNKIHLIDMVIEMNNWSGENYLLNVDAAQKGEEMDKVKFELREEARKASNEEAKKTMSEEEKKAQSTYKPLNSYKFNVDQGHVADIMAQMNLALIMHINATQTEARQDYAFAFVALEQVLEIMRRWNPEYPYNNHVSPATTVYELGLKLMGNAVTNEKAYDEAHGKNLPLIDVQRFVKGRNVFVHKGDIKKEIINAKKKIEAEQKKRELGVPVKKKNIVIPADAGNPQSFEALWKSINYCLEIFEE